MQATDKTYDVIMVDAYQDITTYLADTISGVFPYVYTVDVPGSSNRELFASSDADMTENLSISAQTLENVELSKLMERVSANLTACESQGNLLTDDKAPGSFLSKEIP